MIKNLTQQEFYERVMAVQRATRIFIETGLTKNITHAFSAYQEILAEQERDTFISSQYAKKIPALLDRYERPKCPDCGADMYIRMVPVNEDNIRTVLDCSSSSCDTRLLSDKDINWWIQTLEKKHGELSERVEEGKQEG